MQRDATVIRKIFERILEKRESFDEVDGVSDEVFAFHVQYLMDRRYIDARLEMRGESYFSARVYRATAAGLDYAMNDLDLG